jgi:polyhydroxybutyrate depolymerase
MPKNGATNVLLLGASLVLAAISGCSGTSSSSSGNGGASNGGSSTGGAAQAGGDSSMGGGANTGGLTGSGGVNGTGGALGTGGIQATGGAAATGGTLPTGGSLATGGGLAIGGMAPTGGAKATGGTPSAGGGGAKATGGGAATGGSKAGGGASAAGGSSNVGGGSTGCGAANYPAACSTSGSPCSMDVAGTTRTYYVYLPTNYNASQKYPLVFQFHPMGGTAEQAINMPAIRSSLTAIYVTPQGLTANGNTGWANTNGQDIAFTKAMLSTVEGSYCVDTSRIYSTGFSYGGMMSYAIGCEMSDVFRAIAPMSGALYSDFNCRGTGPHIAMWGSHGASDTFVPTADGRAARDKILQQDHCGSTTSPVDPSSCVMYQGCDTGYSVTWCEFDGQHQMPSFANSAISAFFKQF